MKVRRTPFQSPSLLTRDPPVTQFQSLLDTFVNVFLSSCSVRLRRNIVVLLPWLRINYSSETFESCTYLLLGSVPLYRTYVLSSRLFMVPSYVWSNNCTESNVTSTKRLHVPGTGTLSFPCQRQSLILSFILIVLLDVILKISFWFHVSLYLNRL